MFIVWVFFSGTIQAQLPSPHQSSQVRTIPTLFTFWSLLSTGTCISCYLALSSYPPLCIFLMQQPTTLLVTKPTTTASTSVTLDSGAAAVSKSAASSDTVSLSFHTALCGLSCSGFCLTWFHLLVFLLLQSFCYMYVLPVLQDLIIDVALWGFKYFLSSSWLKCLQ